MSDNEPKDSMSTMTPMPSIWQRPPGVAAYRGSTSHRWRQPGQNMSRPELFMTKSSATSASRYWNPRSLHPRRENGTTPRTCDARTILALSNNRKQLSVTG